MIAIITGASSGIGLEFAKQIDKIGFDKIILIARRKERLKALSEILQSKVQILDLDLRKNESFKILEENIKNEKIGLVINSAGLGINDYFDQISIEKDENVIDVNISALTKIIKIVRPFMAENSSIINVASVAGFIPQPKFAVYAASKSYVINLSRALNMEFKDKKIHVQALCPNPVATEFFQGNDPKFKKFAYEDIEKLVAKSLKKSKSKDLVTTNPLAKIVQILGKIFPHKWIMIIEKLIGLY